MAINALTAREEVGFLLNARVLKDSLDASELRDEVDEHARAVLQHRRQHVALRHRQPHATHRHQPIWTTKYSFVTLGFINRSLSCRHVGNFRCYEVSVYTHP